MLDPLTFPATAILQPSPAQGPGTPASADDRITGSLSTPAQSASLLAPDVGPTRAALVAHDHAHQSTFVEAKPQGDTIAPRSAHVHADLRDAATRFGPSAGSDDSHATAHTTASRTTAAKGGTPGKQNSFLSSTGDFAKGIGEGVWDGASGMIQGVGDLAKGAYRLATSADARSQAADAIANGATAAGDFAKMAATDPTKAASQVGHAASSAINSVSTAYHQAAANGHGAEFIGKAIGQGALLAATLPVGGAEAEGAAALGDAGRIAEAAGGLTKAGGAVTDTGKALQGTDIASNSAAAHATGAAITKEAATGFRGALPGTALNSEVEPSAHFAMMKTPPLATKNAPFDATVYNNAKAGSHTAQNNPIPTFSNESRSGYSLTNAITRDVGGRHPSIGLQAIEQGGPGRPHTLERHVPQTGQNDADMVKKRMLDSIVAGDPAKTASAYSNLATAQKSVDAVIADPVNQKKIQSWIDRALTPSRITLNGSIGEPVGSTITRANALAGKNDTSATNVLIVLQAEPNSPVGYTILTTYPVK